MKTSKFSAAICIIAISLFSAGSLMAQTSLGDMKNSTPEQRAQMQTNLMKSKLTLDSGQLTKVQDINLKYAQKFQPIIKSSDGRISKLKQVMALQKQKDSELQTVFTKDQYKKYQYFEQEIKNKMMSRIGGN